MQYKLNSNSSSVKALVDAKWQQMSTRVDDLLRQLDPDYGIARSPTPPLRLPSLVGNLDDLLGALAGANTASTVQPVEQQRNSIRLTTRTGNVPADKRVHPAVGPGGQNPGPGGAAREGGMRGVAPKGQYNQPTEPPLAGQQQPADYYYYDEIYGNYEDEYYYGGGGVGPNPDMGDEGTQYLDENDDFYNDREHTRRAMSSTTPPAVTTLGVHKFTIGPEDSTYLKQLDAHPSPTSLRSGSDAHFCPLCSSFTLLLHALPFFLLRFT